MEKIIITEEKAKLCRCFDCATYKLEGLSGDPFCGRGPVKNQSFLLHGCECQGCPIREEGCYNKSYPFATTVLFCKAVLVEERYESRPEAVDVDLTVEPVGAGSGAILI